MREEDQDQENLPIDQALDVFMDKMNETARLAGAKEFRFLRPDGYDADGQYTTAYDLAYCARVFMDTEYGDGYLSRYRQATFDPNLFLQMERT